MLVGGKESLDKVVGMPLDGWEEQDSVNIPQ